jgi:4-amino-4-deoxy-L-arabinose transferase-like glycosyltransferase
LARGFAFARSAVEHFDEGVYASNVYFGAPDYAYPQQRFYAPPLLPALIEAGMIAGLPPNVAALLPAFLAGCGTIVAVWWFGRGWFGPPVGLAAAALVGLSDFHVTFSAMALTDVLLGLWLVLAVDAMGRSLAGTLTPALSQREREKGQVGRLSYGWAIAAGIYTSLAWWTKYNGWLPLAIEGASLPVLWFFLRPSQRELLDWIGCFVLTVIVAALVWMPFYISLQSVGGYGPIATNHAKYVVGFSGWLDSTSRQIANQYVLATPLCVLSVVLAFFASGALSPRNTWQRMWRDGISLGVGVLVIFWSSIVVVGIGSLMGLARTAIALQKGACDRDLRRPTIGLTLVAVWWLGMLVATPCYTPYPRLVLPWLLAAWLGMALHCSDLLHVDDPQPTRPIRPRMKRTLGYAAIVLFFLVPWLFFPMHAPDAPVTDRRGLVTIAEQIRATDVRREPRVLYVFGEPAIFFQLKAAGEPIVSPVQIVPTEPATENGRPIPTYLVAGPHANRDPQFAKEWTASKDRWQLVQEFEYEPSLVVWLDLADPRKSPQSTRDLDRVRLYRLRESRSLTP